MRAFMMAAGLGERLAPLTLSKPKALMPVANRPVVCRLLDMLQSLNNESRKIDELIISLYSLPDEVKDVIGNGCKWNKKVNYSIEPEPEGTAGGLARVTKFLEVGRFLLMSTDIVTDIDLTEAITTHENSDAKMTLVMTDRYIYDPAMSEALIGVGSDGRIVANRSPNQKTKTGIYTGIAICEPSILKIIPKGYSTLLESVLLPLAEEGALNGYFANGYWRDIGTVDNYIQANMDIINGRTKLDVNGRLIGDNIWIDETAEIDFSVRIEEPALIGKGVTVDRGAVIGPNVVIGDMCEVGPKVEIAQSVIWNNSRIDGSTSISSSIIADKQRITSGHRLSRIILHGGVSEAIFNL